MLLLLSSLQLHGMSQLAGDDGLAIPHAADAASFAWPFFLSCCSGLSTVLGAVLVIAFSSSSSSPSRSRVSLGPAHLAFTSGLACAVMLFVSTVQMIVPAALTNGATQTAAVATLSALLTTATIKLTPIDKVRTCSPSPLPLSSVLGPELTCALCCVESADAGLVGGGGGAGCG